MKHKINKIIILLLIILICISLYGMCISYSKDSENIETIANKGTISDGTYVIRSALNSKYVIDITGGSTKVEANVQLYEYTGVAQQKYKVTYLGDGYYTIMAVHSNKVLDVANGGMQPGTNVWQHASNGTDAQKWTIKDAGNGYYYIISKKNGLYLDVNNAEARNGTNIKVFTGTGSYAQRFMFDKIDDSNNNPGGNIEPETPKQPEIQGTKTLNNGNYVIRSALNDKYVIDITGGSTKAEANVQLYEYTGVPQQRYKITYLGDGFYTIMAIHSGKVLDVANGGMQPGTNVWQHTSNGTDAQKWVIKESGDGYFYIISKKNGLFLDVNSTTAKNGANIRVYTETKSSAQKFKFEPYEIKGTKSAEDGTYRIISTVDNKKVFDVESASMQNGGIIQVWDNTKQVLQQKFEIEYVENGFYKIRSKNSKKVLTVESESPRIGSQITQEDDKNLDTQKWILKEQGKNLYSIVSKCGSLFIDLGKSYAQNGQNLQLKEETNSNSQIFIFVNETPKQNIVQSLQDGVYQIQLKSNKVLDVVNGGYNNFANVQIYANNVVQQQKFHVTKIPNTNCYRITAVHSAKVLDVYDGNSNFCANISQCEWNSTDNQCWYLKANEDGYYTIISKANGLCLDVENSNINVNGTNIQLHYDKGVDAQKFKFIPVNIINNNTYEIETKLNENMILDVVSASKENKANIQLYTADNVDQQKFKLEALTTDTYKITAKHSNKALTVDMQSSNVYQSDYIGESNQQWQIKEAGEGYYTLICKANGKALDVYDGKDINGQNIWTCSPNGTNAQKFRFVTGQRNYFEEGTYGRSGLAVKGDYNGTNLKYYKFGKGSKKLFTGFSIHGFEDSYNHDGAELTFIAEEFKNYLKNNLDSSIINNWTIYIFPCLNPDGQNYGWTNNGPGRNTLYSMAPGNRGIDMNRNWSVGYKRETSSRNYNGTEAFQAYEARDLRDFILNHQGSKNIVIDIHGWLNETIGDYGLGAYYRNQFGLPNHIYSYGSGYFVNWARTLSNTRSVLVELPQVWGHDQTVNWNYPQKFINATMQMLREN